MAYAHWKCKQNMVAFIYNELKTRTLDFIRLSEETAVGMGF